MPSPLDTTSPTPAANAPDWFRTRAVAAWTEFQSLPLPDIKDENWRYSNSKRIDLSEHSVAQPADDAQIQAALAASTGLQQRSARFVFVNDVLVDADTTKVGRSLGDLEIRHVDELPQLVDELGIAIGVIATPAHVAQGVADKMAEAGIHSVLNFAPAVITVPDGVSLRKVDLAVELQILSFYQQHRHEQTV